MASEHKRIVERLEALERRYDEDNELRRVHCEHHKGLEERQKALEESVSLLDKVAARNDVVEERLGWHVDRMNRLEGRVQTAEALLRDAGRKFDALEARLACKPDDFGGVTSTGAPKTMTRWVITTAETGSRFSRWKGMVRAGNDVEEPSFFETQEEAEAVRKAIFSGIEWLYVHEVDVIERDGRLIEVRYA